VYDQIIWLRLPNTFAMMTISLAIHKKNIKKRDFETATRANHKSSMIIGIYITILK
jgi:hypothetical protein